MQFTTVSSVQLSGLSGPESDDEVMDLALLTVEV